jgi:hypothetical protein
LSGNPKPGTIYRELHDLCRTVLGLRGLTAPSGGPCQTRIDDVCCCCWYTGDFQVFTHVPQALKASPCAGGYSPALAGDLRARLRGERIWDRKTAFLHVVRTARQGIPHLAWVDLDRISTGFSLALPPSVIREAHAVLQRMIADDRWFEPVLRRDGGYDLEPAAGTPRRPVRRVSILTATERITVGEYLDARALPVFAAPLAYSLHRSTFPDDVDGRVEVLQFELSLARWQNNKG